MKLVIVLGCPRSGTTWVFRMLGEHPEIARCATETHFFPRLLEPLLTTWDELEGTPVGLHRDVPTSEFEAGCRQFVLSLLEKVRARTPGARALLEKTPANAIVWPSIHRLFPEARFVHVLRDPRDVVSSIRAASGSWGSHWAPSSPITAARIWRRHVTNALEIPEKTDRVRTVRYEALLDSGVSELESLFRFAGVASDRALCERIYEATRFDRLRATLTAPRGFLRNGRAGSWRKELTLGQARVVEYLTGDLMDALGYERALPSPLRTPLSVALIDAFDATWSATRQAGAAWRRRVSGLGEPRRPAHREAPARASVEPRSRAEGDGAGGGAPAALRPAAPGPPGRGRP